MRKTRLLGRLVGWRGAGKADEKRLVGGWLGESEVRMGDVMWCEIENINYLEIPKLEDGRIER